jgi:hypothetical protein
MSLSKLRLRRADDTAGQPVQPQAAPAEETLAQTELIPGMTPDTGDEVAVSPMGGFGPTVRDGIRVSAGRARDAARREGGPVHWVLRTHPRSIGDQHDHLRLRRYLGGGVEGGPADRIGEAFHLGIGLPAVTAGAVISAAGSSIPGFAAADVLGGTLLACGLHVVVGEPWPAAFWDATGVALIPFVWVALVMAVLAGWRALWNRGHEDSQPGTETGPEVA